MKYILLTIILCAPWSIFSQNWIPVGSNPGFGSDAVSSLFADTVTNDLYVGGPFKYFKGLTVNGIVRIDSLGVPHALGTAQDGCGPWNCTPIKVITRYKNEIYVSWVDNTINGGTVVNGIARWDGTSWKSLQNGFNQIGAANGFQEFNGELYIAGSFDITIDSVTQYAIAKWDGVTWTGLGFPKFPGDYPLAQASAWYKGKLYLGGSFEFAAGSDNILDIASYDGNQWSAVGDGIKGGIWHGINDMVVYKDELYVCGLFRSIDGNAGNKIMRWDGNQWKDVGGGICDANATLHHMLVHDGKLYVVGIFSCVGDGIPASCIASWDGDRWCSCGNSIFVNRIISIAFWHDSLFVGGGFSSVDDKPVAYFAKWIGDHSTDTCSAVVSVQPEPPARLTFSMSPNPAQHQLQLSCIQPLDPAHLRVYDCLGRLCTVGIRDVKGGLRLELDLVGCAPGVYWVSGATEAGVSVQEKFIKD